MRKNLSVLAAEDSLVPNQPIDESPNAPTV